MNHAHAAAAKSIRSAAGNKGSGNYYCTVCLCRPMDYWIAGLMDCCKSKSYAKITIWEKSEMPILKFSLKSSIYGFS
jgi:hypothetical protein